MDLFNQNGAVFDNDVRRQYRYVLWRTWDERKPYVNFIGLNPSTADQDNDDPTIRRVKRFASDWGYGGIYMTNLFALVTPYPSILASVPDPLGDNNSWLSRIATMCKDVLFAWGSFPQAKERAQEVIRMFPDALALVINQDGTPRHPLYVKSDVIPVKYATHE
ncbi:MAG: DUF1643 domain-containing protein [Paludibacter sp.]|nr:DUF1643 domain-containing protein [Paludibacter sp.]